MRAMFHACGFIILFFGDSITDMNRERETKERVHSYGDGYVFLVASKLQFAFPKQYEIVNRGISGNGIFHLYSRIYGDVWLEKPDVLTILIGVNDIIGVLGDSVDVCRWGEIYRMLINDTQKRLPNTKIVLCEPFALKGSATDCLVDKGFFEILKKYREEIKNISKEYGLPLVFYKKNLKKLQKNTGRRVII